MMKFHLWNCCKNFICCFCRQPIRIENLEPLQAAFNLPLPPSPQTTFNLRSGATFEMSKKDELMRILILRKYQNNDKSILPELNEWVEKNPKKIIEDYSRREIARIHTFLYLFIQNFRYQNVRRIEKNWNDVAWDVLPGIPWAPRLSPTAGPYRRLKAFMKRLHNWDVTYFHRLVESEGSMESAELALSQLSVNQDIIEEREKIACSHH